jgi:hypothetical protein
MAGAVPGNLLTTAMAVMPHTDVARALDAALSLDVPFWPQLPNYSYHEDMYVQAAEHFPGIVLDLERRTLRFSIDSFAEELDEALLGFEDPARFDVSEAYSAVYSRFLALDLRDRPAIRGQLEGPISFGFNVLDQDRRPILFDDTVRPFMFEFLAKRLNVQLARLKERNANAFMFVDEPGLQFLFSAMAGYTDMQAKGDLDQFFSQVDRPRGVHLCGNPDWDFLLNLDMDVVSLDVHTNTEILTAYAGSLGRFLDRGGVVVWGIVPTASEAFAQEEVPSLIRRVEDIWRAVCSRGVDRDLLLARSMLSPATCSLVNPDREATVERAFAAVNQIADVLRAKYL